MASWQAWRVQARCVCLAARRIALRHRREQRRVILSGLGLRQCNRRQAGLGLCLTTRLLHLVADDMKTDEFELK